jgi:sec-independent protein translocase protein TatC
MIAIGVIAPFMAPFKLSFYVALFAAMPVVIYQLWAFIAPGLYAREKRWGHIFLATAIPLFLLGNLLAYLSLGRSMHYLLDLTPHGVQNLIQVDLYMSFVMTMLLAFGIALELPLLIVMLNLAGILTHERFRKWRRVLIFVVFLIAGIANPSPDPITMLILGGACVALVEVAELIIWRHDRRQARLHPDPYAGLADDELSPLDLDDTGSRDSHLN